MATNAELLAAISSANDLAATPLQMVAVLDQKILEATVSRAGVVSYTIGGRSLTVSLDQLRQMRKEYWDLHLAQLGGFSSASCEMTSL